MYGKLEADHMPGERQRPRETWEDLKVYPQAEPWHRQTIKIIVINEKQISCPGGKRRISFPKLTDLDVPCTTM